MIYLARHDVCVEYREDQSQDSSIEETKVGLEDDACAERRWGCHEKNLVQNKINAELFLRWGQGSEGK